MDVTGSVQVVLHLDRNAPVIRGWTSDSRGAEIEFYGWLELSALLDALRSATGADPAKPSMGL